VFEWWFELHIDHRCMNLSRKEEILRITMYSEFNVHMKIIRRF